MSKNATKDKKRKNHANALRNQKIIAEAASGKSAQEIAKEYNVSRSSIHRVLSSDEAKQLVKEGNSELTSLIADAIEVTKKILRGHDMGLAFQAAVRVLKSVGIMRDKVDIAHSYPKPTVIKRSDGTEVILGLSTEGDE